MVDRQLAFSKKVGGGRLHVSLSTGFLSGEKNGSRKMDLVEGQVKPTAEVSAPCLPNPAM